VRLPPAIAPSRRRSRSGKTAARKKRTPRRSRPGDRADSPVRSPSRSGLARWRQVFRMRSTPRGPRRHGSRLPTFTRQSGSEFSTRLKPAKVQRELEPRKRIKSRNRGGQLREVIQGVSGIFGEHRLADCSSRQPAANPHCGHVCVFCEPSIWPAATCNTLAACAPQNQFSRRTWKPARSELLDQR
jgi:hypothetical protein